MKNVYQTAEIEIVQLAKDAIMESDLGNNLEWDQG